MTPEMFRNAKHLIVHSEHFEKDCDYFFCELSKNFDWFKGLNIGRQLAVVALAFVLGWKNFILLADLLFFLSRHNYSQASIAIEEIGLFYIADVIRGGEIKFAESK